MGLLYVNANDLAWTSSMALNTPAATARELYTAQCATCHGADMGGNGGEAPSLKDIKSRRTAEQISDIIRKGAGRMPGFPNLSAAALRTLVQYLTTGDSMNETAPVERSPFDLKYRFTGYKKFLDPDGYPAVAPPWGTLNAINLNTGKYAWKIPFGEYPELAEKGMKDTGSESYGGPVVTAGGLLIIAATNYDQKLRVFDKANGKLLWETRLPFSANATPAVYSAGGRQFIVVNAEGSKGRANEPKGGRYIAFALPQR